MSRAVHLMNRKMMLSVITGLACGLAVLAASAAGASAKTITAKFSLAQAANTPLFNTVSRFDADVYKYSKHTLKIKLYPNSVLGTQEAQLEGVENNTIQFQATGSGLDGIVPGFDVTLLPYIFPSAQAAQVVLDNGSLDKALWDKFQAKGLHYVGMYEVGFSDMISKQPIYSAADIKGQTIRVVGATVGAAEFGPIGADAVNLSSTEVLTALQTGTVTAVDDPAATMYSDQWYSVANNIAVTKMTYAGDPVMVSEKFWTSLTPVQQAAINKAYQQTEKYNIQQSTAYNVEALTKMQAAGVNVTHPALAGLSKAFSSTYQSSFGKSVAPLVKIIRQGVGAAKKG